MRARALGAIHRLKRAASGGMAFTCIAISALAAEAPPPLDKLVGVQQAGFNHDASRVVVQFGEKRVGLWDVASGAPVAPDAGWQAPAAAVVMSADGRNVLLFLEEGGALIFDASSGKALGGKLEVQPRDPGFLQVVFSPDAASVVIFEAKAAAVFAVADGSRVATLALAGGVAEEELSPSAVFTRDGATCFIMDAVGTVTRYDAKTWKPTGKPLRHPAAEFAFSYGLAIDENARWLTTYDDPGENGPKGHLQVWDLANHRAVGKPVVAVNGVSGTFLPPGNRLLLTPGRGEAGVRVLPSLKKLYAIRAHDDVDAPRVVSSPDGKWLISSGADQMIRVIDAATGAAKETHSFQATISHLLPLPDSTGFLAVFDNSSFLTLKHYDQYVVRVIFDGHKIAATLRLTENLHRAVLSPDGRRLLLVAGSSDTTRLHIFDAASLKPLAR